MFSSIRIGSVVVKEVNSVVVVVVVIVVVYSSSGRNCSRSSVAWKKAPHNLNVRSGMKNRMDM